MACGWRAAGSLAGSSRTLHLLPLALVADLLAWRLQSIQKIHAALQLMALAVREDRQSQGIGTALLEELLRIGKG